MDGDVSGIMRGGVEFYSKEVCYWFKEGCWDDCTKLRLEDWFYLRISREVDKTVKRDEGH